MPAFTVEFTLVCADLYEALDVTHDVIVKALRRHAANQGGSAFWVHEATKLKAP